MKAIKTLIITGLAAVAAVTAGCGKQEVKQETTAQKSRTAECVGGECKLPALAEASELETTPNVRTPQTAPLNASEGQSIIKTVYRKLPGAQPAEAPVVAKIKPAARPADLQAMAGDEGHFNDVKLPGIAHTDLPEEQPFLVKRFNKSVWPGGMPLEAEVDPEIANF